MASKDNATTTKAKKPREEEEEVDEPEAEGGDEAEYGAIDDQLDALDDWEDTEEKELGDVPPGTYQVKFSEVNINNSKSSGRLQVSFVMTILDTGHRGRKLFTHFGLDDVGQRGFLRGALAKLGIDWPSKPKELPDVLSSVEDTFAQVKVVHRKRKDKEGDLMMNVNTYFSKALDSSEVDDIEDEAEGDREPAPPTTAKTGKKAKTEKTEKPATKTEKTDTTAKKPAATEKTQGEGVDFQPVRPITKDEKKAIRALAEAHDFDQDDYDKLEDLLADIGEEVGLSGKFTKPERLIAKIEALTPKKGAGEEAEAEGEDQD